MPEIFINGQPVEARDGPDRHAGGAGSTAIFIPYFCWHPQPVGRRQLPHLRGRGRGRGRRAGSRSPATCRSTEGMRVLTDSEHGARAPQGDAAVHHAQPPGRLRHLRQGRRVHAAGLPLRRTTASRRSRTTPRCTPTKFYHAVRAASCSTTSAASCARAACASRARSRSRTRWASQNRGDHSLVRAGRGRRASTRDPYSDNVDRHLPGRRAAVAARSCTRRASGTCKPTPSVCPGCERGCTRQHLAPQAASGSCKALDPKQNARDRPRHAAARTRPSTGRGSATRAATWRRSSSAPRADAADAQGPAGRRCRRRIAAARALIGAARQPGGAGVELGLERGARGLQGARSATRFTRFVKADCAAGARRASSRTTC
ncbi:MAG: hypothetical protein MZV64_44685 [Ignavibacteriales bacterium]|nr:hypothetical protein [Ignavibacteriales bacterium]